MNTKYKLIQRHKNPLGLALRVITYFLIGYALWKHMLWLVLLLFLVDLVNWFFMPTVKPENESRVINTIIEKEIAFIKSPGSAAKSFSIFIGFTLVILLTIGLWNHNWVLLVVAFICLVLLKQVLLKTTAPVSNNQNSLKSLINHNKQKS